TNTDISNRAVRSALLPSLDLFAYYGGSGAGGNSNSNYICVTNPPFCGLTVPPPVPPPVSYGATLNQLINSTAPDKGIGLSLNIPLRNRAGQANQVRIEVRNAQFGVQQNRASVDSAQAAVDLARQSLDAEQKKYALGASTST